MLDPVFRDVDIVSNDKSETSSGTVVTTQTESAINTWNGHAVTSLVTVDGAAGQAALQSALDSVGAGGVVVASGDFGAVTATTTLGDYQTLLGGGTTLKIRGAETGLEMDYTTSGVAGKLEGDVQGRMVRMNNGGVVGGMTLRNHSTGAYGNAITAQSVSNISIFENTLNASNASTASAVILTDVTGAKIHGNDASTELSTFIVDTSNDISIRDNKVRSGSFDGVSLRGLSNNIQVVGNEVSVRVAVSDNAAIGISRGSVLISNNIIAADNAGPAIRSGTANFQAGSTGNVELSGVTPRCRMGVGGSGTVEFTDGVNCSH